MNNLTYFEDNLAFVIVDLSLIIDGQISIADHLTFNSYNLTFIGRTQSSVITLPLMMIMNGDNPTFIINNMTYIVYNLS